MLSRKGLSLFARRRPIDIVAELVERLGSGTAEEEEVRAFAEAFGHL